MNILLICLIFSKIKVNQLDTTDIIWSRSHYSENATNTDTSQYSINSEHSNKSDSSNISANAYIANVSDSSGVSSNSHNSVKSDSSLISASSYIANFSDSSGISANSHNSEKSDSSLISANSYHSDKSDSSLISANSYHSDKSDSSLVSANSYHSDSATVLFNTLVDTIAIKNGHLESNIYRASFGKQMFKTGVFANTNADSCLGFFFTDYYDTCLIGKAGIQFNREGLFRSFFNSAGIYIYNYDKGTSTQISGTYLYTPSIELSKELVLNDVATKTQLIIDSAYNDNDSVVCIYCNGSITPFKWRK